MTTINRRQLLLGGASLALGSLTGAATLHAAASLKDVELKISVYRGHTANFFADAGVADFPYRVNYAEFPASSNLLVEAVSNGALDMAGSGNISAMLVNPARARFRQIADLHNDANIYSLVVRPDSAIGSIEQLKGKRVGYLRATLPHYFLLKVLKAHGLSIRDVKAIPLMQQDGYAAFKTGQLDAWAPGGLFSAFAARDGARVLAKGQDYFLSRGVTVINSAQLADAAKREAVTDYLAREKHTLEWIETHPTEWARKMQQLTTVPAAIYLQQFEGRSNATTLNAVSQESIAAQQDAMDEFAAAKLLPQRFDVTPLWDRRFAAAFA